MPRRGSASWCGPGPAIFNWMGLEPALTVAAMHDQQLPDLQPPASADLLAGRPAAWTTGGLQGRGLVKAISLMRRGNGYLSGWPACPGAWTTASPPFTPLTLHSTDAHQIQHSGHVGCDWMSVLCFQAFEDNFFRLNVVLLPFH